MKKYNLNRFIFLILSVVFIFITATVFVYSDNRKKKPKQQQYVQGEVIVKFRSGTSESVKSGKIAALGEKIEKKGLKFNKGTGHGHDQDVHHVKLRDGKKVEDAIKEYEKDPDVEYVQPNYIYKINLAPNDPNYSSMWGLKNSGQTVSGGSYSTNNPGSAGFDMDMEKAWAKTTGSNVVVAVVDSGVNYNHQDLADNMWDGTTKNAAWTKHGWDCVNNNNDPMDLNGHGTHVAGTIGAVGSNNLGGAGVCWNVKIMAVRVLNAAGSGTSADIAEGITFAYTNGAKVINMSLGGYAYDNLIYNAISSAKTNGVLVVVAAGNDANDNNGTYKTYPCSYSDLDNIICVAALDQKYQLASFSNYGSSYVHVGAPGTNILSTFAGNKDTIIDDLITGWTMPSDWGYNSTLAAGFSLLVNPLNFPNGAYASYANSIVYKTFSIPAGISSISLDFYAYLDLETNYDYLQIYSKGTAGDPQTGSLIAQKTGNYDDYFSYSVPSWTTVLTIGFKLTSDSSVQWGGVVIGDFVLNTMQLNNTTFRVFDGTSMATPHVAGLAALILSYNTTYSYSDVVNAIKWGGESTAALAGKTTTERAVNAWGSLKYINKPTGIILN